jgi:hypothetical protein
MGLLARAKKTEVVEMIGGWGKGDPKDKTQTYGRTDLQIAGKPFATVSHKQTSLQDGTVFLGIAYGTGLSEGEPGSSKGNLRIAMANMPSLQVVTDEI